MIAIDGLPWGFDIEDFGTVLGLDRERVHRQEDGSWAFAGFAVAFENQDRVLVYNTVPRSATQMLFEEHMLDVLSEYMKSYTDVCYFIGTLSEWTQGRWKLLHMRWTVLENRPLSQASLRSVVLG